MQETIMKVFVLVGHQRPGSFNHAIADAVLETLEEIGREYYFHDLYEEKFDPMLYDREIPIEASQRSDVEQHTRELKGSDGIVVIHPNWWGMPPAVLKGWLDRVLRQGFAYKFTPDGAVPYFTDKTVQVFTTSNTPRDVEIQVYNDPLEILWKKVIFGLCGSKSFERRNFESVIMSRKEEREAWLMEVRETTRRRFQPES
jgi:putative NADPH-quinone reductase